MVILAIVIYLVGYVASYISLKGYLQKDDPTWTIGDRVFGLFASLFSWIGVLVTLVLSIKLSDKPAKW